MEMAVPQFTRGPAYLNKDVSFAISVCVLFFACVLSSGIWAARCSPPSQARPVAPPPEFLGFSAEEYTEVYRNGGFYDGPMQTFQGNIILRFRVPSGKLASMHAPTWAESGWVDGRIPLRAYKDIYSIADDQSEFDWAERYYANGVRYAFERTDTSSRLLIVDIENEQFVFYGISLR